jgi:NADH dehydrogenase [ubiquinone] 1 alpha subcomplex assembly factor 7
LITSRSDTRVPFLIPTLLQAFKNHASVSPFDQPGTADLTANVDFRFLASSLPPTSIRTLGPMTQADFLEQMGISIRLSELLKQPSLSEETKTSLEEAIERLVDRNAMGSEYQFFGVESRGAEEPGGRDSPYPFPSPETP